MKRKDFNGKKIIFILSFFIFMGTLFALDMPKVDQNAIFALLQKKDVDIQSLYDDMSDLIPAIVYLQPNYTSGIDLELVKKVDFEIKNQMITSMTFKPVTMNKWLDSNYGTKKALSIYQLINDLKKERYSVNLTGLCKSYIYRIGKSIVIKISIYPFSRNGYPISAIRIIKSERDMKTAIKYILDDLSTLMKTELESKIRLAVEPFSVNCRTLIEQKTGEFDFISTSFSNQEGVEIKNTDDYFSELFSYQAQCTGLFDATNTQNIDEYIDAVKRKSTYYSGNSDYLIKGNIVLSNKLNLITIQLINTNTGKVVRTMRHITKFLFYTKLNKYHL